MRQKSARVFGMGPAHNEKKHLKDLYEGFKTSTYALSKIDFNKMHTN